MDRKIKGLFGRRRMLLWGGLSAALLIVGITTSVLWSLGALPWNQSTRDAKPAVIVNGDAITRSEFEEAYEGLLNRYRASLSGVNRLKFERDLAGASGAHYELQLKSQLADELIRQALIRQATREFGIGISEGEIRQRLREQLWSFLEANGVPPERIEQALQDPKTYQSPFTRDLRRRIRQQVLEDRLRERVVGPMDPTEDELREYYQRNRLRYFMPELVHVRHILIRIPEDAGEELVETARRKITEIRSQWEEGENFAALARRYSEDELSAPQGGDYGWIQRGDPTGESFVEAAFALEGSGDVSPPVRTERGFHLIQLVERRPAQGASYEDVAFQVRRDYLRDKTEERYQDWYRSYRGQAEIRIELPLLAAYRLEDEDPHAALRAYEKLKDEGHVEDPYLGYYIARLYQRELDGAQRKLDRLKREGGPPEEIAWLEAQVASLTRDVVRNLKDVLAQGKREQEIFEAILDVAPQDVEARYGFARFYIDHGRWDAAAQQLRRVLELAPEHPGALADYGRLLLDMKDYEKAAVYLERALQASEKAGRPGAETERERPELELALAQAYRELGRLEDFNSTLRRALERAPEHPEANRMLGEIELEQGAYAEAVRLFKRALAQIPSASSELRGELEILLGRAHLGADDGEEAERAFKRALETPAAAAAHLNLGDLDRDRGQTDQALQHYRQGLEQAVAWEMKERLASRIVALIPQDLEARRTLGELYDQRRQYHQAVEQYRALVELQPDDIGAWRRLGDAHLNLKEYAQALEAYQNGLPHATSSQEQAGLWARILRADRARGSGDVTEQGLEALYRLAELSFERGEDEKAGRYLSELIEADPAYRADDVEAFVDKLRQKGVKVTLP